MKTKLLIIFSILFASQVFAKELTIRCDISSLGSIELYRYIDKIWGSKVQHKLDGDWMDIEEAIERENDNYANAMVILKKFTNKDVYNYFQKNIEVEVKDMGVLVKQFIQLDKSKRAQLNLSDEREAKIFSKKNTTYIDFEIPSIKFINHTNPNYNYYHECRQIKHGE